MDYLWAQGAEVFNFDPVADDDHFEGGRGTQIVDDVFDGGAYHAVIVTLCHTVFRPTTGPGYPDQPGPQRGSADRYARYV